GGTRPPPRRASLAPRRVRTAGGGATRGTAERRRRSARRPRGARRRAPRSDGLRDRRCRRASMNTIAAAGNREASMASTVTWDTLRELAGFRADKGRAISLYVDLDP